MPRSFFAYTPSRPPTGRTPEEVADDADFDREEEAMYLLLSDTVFAYWDAHPHTWRMDATLAALDLARGFFEDLDRQMDADRAAEEADA
jgi:hypothetical protein